MKTSSMDHTTKNPDSSHNYVFTVELMIEGQSNGFALEKLTRLLNCGEVKDYRILNGIELGKVIEEELERHQEKLKKDREQTKPKALETAKKEDLKLQPQTEESREIISQILSIKEKGSLVRLSINKGKGVKLNFPCRVLNIDPVTYNISVYHVDEKKVYLFQLYEIDDLTEFH